MSVISRLRQHTAYRFGSRTVRIAAAILAVAIVATLTIDLGPAVRGWVEREGSKQLKRPIHLGGLHLRLLTGAVVVSDFAIEGLRPADRPFFSARRVEVTLNWTTLVRKEVTIESIALSDWQMLVEKWADRNNFPKFGGTDDKEPDKPKRFTTTLQWVRATKGEFTYDDHEKPWSTVARNLEIAVTNLPSYHGEATFNGGTVTIQDFVPMWANMRAWFTIEKGRINLQRIDLQTDGATSVATGSVDLKHWPEQSYDVKSRVHFPRMREIFFARETWRVSGDADFTGTFHLFKGGHDLHGTFASDLAGVNDYRFPSLYGSLRWTPASFQVWNAGSKFYGGSSTFTYAIEPLGSPERPTQRFNATYTDVDLAAFSEFEQLRGLRFAGRASGRNTLEWPSGRFSERRGDGHVVAMPPPGVTPMTASLDAARAADANHTRHEWGPFAAVPLASHLPIAADLTYHFDEQTIEIEPSRFATERTDVTFQGSTAWGERSRFGFHVTSSDWQESDQVLAGILTDFGSKTGSVAVGGRGEFDGMMTGAFRHPRVEGEFDGEDMRAWDTLWGSGSGHLLIENGYVKVTDGVMRLGDAEIRAEGLFSLGYPRDDKGQEIDARFRVVRRDLDALRHAFQLDEYPVTGRLSGDFHLTGRYEHPIGFGGMTIDNGTAYTEPFQKATASLRFDGVGVRLDGITIEKNGGTVTGAAFVGWDSTYSFNADGRRIPIERVSAFAVSQAPLSGLGEFTAGGSGTFDQPRYDVRFRASGVFIGEEGIGQVTGTLALRGKELSGDVAAASPRLAISGTGRIALTPQADAEITFRFHDSSLDPYVRLFVPRLSPFTTAVGSGTIRVVGELTDVNHLLVDGSIDTLEMSLFDYALRNRQTLHLALNQQEVRLGDENGPLELVGDGTALRLAGTVGLRERRIAVKASGEANLGILQGFFKDVRSSGRAELTAAIDGLLDDPVFSGRATIADGRIRHFSVPNSLDAINGAIHFDARGIRLDEVTAKLGEGDVHFGGRIGFKGYFAEELDVTARGEDMRLRYPEGVRSVVAADLFLRGSVKAPTLGGSVTVKSASWSKPFDTPGSLFDSARREPTGLSGGSGAVATVVPVKYDVHIIVPSTLHVDNNLIRQLVASADLQLVGTYDRPVLSGHADVERGELMFEGRRYKLTRGTIGFYNPTRIDPFFDIQAETTVRVPGQTYRVTVTAAGTSDRMVPTFESDPPLPPVDVLALLLTEARHDINSAGSTATNAELRAMQNPNQRQTDILAARATQAFTSSLSGGVGKVVEQTFGVDTFQLTPSFLDPYNQQSPRVNPSARLTIGKRISDRAYLTFSRSLNTTVYDQIILLEYDASDRLSWILSRNEDQSYALEFRVRHVF